MAGALYISRSSSPRPDVPGSCGNALEPNWLLSHWYACQRALGIRVRGLYCTKDTFVTTALYRMRETNQIDIPSLGAATPAN